MQIISLISVPVIDSADEYATPEALAHDVTCSVNARLADEAGYLDTGEPISPEVVSSAVLTESDLAFMLTALEALGQNACEADDDAVQVKWGEACLRLRDILTHA